MQKPRPSSCHLYAGGRLGSKQVSPKLILNQTKKLSFDLVFTVSTPHQWFACTHLLDPYLPRSFAVTFPSTLTTMAFDHSSLRWFEACSCKPAPRGLPSSLAQLRAAIGELFYYTYVHSWRSLFTVSVIFK